MYGWLLLMHDETTKFCKQCPLGKNNKVKYIYIVNCLLEMLNILTSLARVAECILFSYN